MGERVEFIVMKKRWEINKGREKTKLVGLTLLLRIVNPNHYSFIVHILFFPFLLLLLDVLMQLLCHYYNSLTISLFLFALLFLMCENLLNHILILFVAYNSC